MTMQVLENVEQTIELHKQAIEQLEAYRDTLQQMQGTLEALTGSPLVEPSNETKVSSTTTKSATKKRAPAKHTTDDNEISLREAVWNVISRKENKDGIRVAQVISTIKEEGIWTTDGDLSNMVHGAVYKLKKEDKLVRGDDKTYKIAKGAKLDS